MTDVFDNKTGKLLYRKPPYTLEEEADFYRRTGGGPVAFTRPSPPAAAGTEQEPQAPRPDAVPRQAR